jgi:myo-inositol-1(or 4)-monophosphatase
MDKKIKNVAIDAVKKSGKMLLEEYLKFDRHDSRLKAHNELVTKCDLRSEEIILGEIRRSFPLDGIISEERGTVKGVNNLTWILDPIDGTTNFSFHNPLWCISLALAKEEGLILGIIYAPYMDELFVGIKGEGALLNGRPIKVSNIKDGKILNTFCHGREKNDIKKALKYYSKQKLADKDCRQMGTAALELAYVAAGRVESFVAPGDKIWDVAAGVLLVEEAGGKLTDFNGKPWRFDSPDIVASNGLIHKDILKALK